MCVGDKLIFRIQIYIFFMHLYAGVSQNSSVLGAIKTKKSRGKKVELRQKSFYTSNYGSGKEMVRQIQAVCQPLGSAHLHFNRS